MIEELIKEMNGAKTPEELMAFKPKILGLIDAGCLDVSENGCGITNYEDIHNMVSMKSSMTAYFGFNFVKDCAVPFLKDHDSTRTLDILNLTILFYTLQVLELLENGFFNNITLLIYDEHDYNDMNPRFETINFIESSDDENLFYDLWYYFKNLITMDKYQDGRAFEIDCLGKCLYYIDDDTYETVLNMTYRNFSTSKYKNIIKNILGIYRLRFTDMSYILNYQPEFVEAAYDYLMGCIL